MTPPAAYVAGIGRTHGPLGDAPVTGYTVISADSPDAAAKACEDHPHIKHGGWVELFTCIDMSGDG